MNFNKALNECGISTANIIGVDNPSLIDWASSNGPQTDLGKRAMKKKKIARRKIFSVTTKT